MMKKMLAEAREKLIKHGASPVYSAFDAVSTERKERGIYTIIGIGSFESTAPIYSFSTIFLPFRAELEIKVTAPPDRPAEELYEYFSEKVLPAAAELSSTGSFLKRVSMKFDSNIDRLVLTAVVSAAGTAKLERRDLL